jgi:hypothetical protein
MVRSNRLKPEEVAESLDSDLRAALGELDLLLQERLGAIVERVGQELGVGLPLDVDDLDAPAQLVAPPEGAEDHRDGLAKVTGFMPSIFGAAALPGVVGSMGVLVPALAPIAPLAAAVGLSLIPLNIVQRKRTKNQQEATRVIREGIERARIEIPPVLTKSLLTVRRRIEADLQSGIEQREHELAAAVEEQRRLAEADAASRVEAKNAAEKRLKQLRDLRARADALDERAVRTAIGT